MTAVLILTRHYPPAVSGGAKRPFLLAQGLRASGADVRVCAPSLPDREAGWQVPHPNRDPAAFGGPQRASIRDVARDWLLWPDPDIRWCQRAADRVIDSGWRPDWVISTSPPESIHLAGARIAEATGARWMADFRDLWLQSPHRRERLRPHRRIGERMIARNLLSRADLVTTVDDVVAAEARDFGAKNVQVLPHFVSSHRPQPAALNQDALNIVHSGSISLSDPEADILALLGPFEAALGDNRSLLLHLVGRLTHQEQQRVLESPSAERIKLHGVMSLEASGELVAAADALAFVASTKMHVPPSKLVDYLTHDVPIIACGEGPWRADVRVPKGSPAKAMAQLRRGDRRNVAVPPPMLDVEAAAFVRRWFDAIDR
jgi:glycosyltransferase involved in cell wall biosynthesis